MVIGVFGLHMTIALTTQKNVKESVRREDSLPEEGHFICHIAISTFNHNYLYRVLGILAVTRSFGDHGMKDFVTAQPHLLETDLTIHGESPFMILACDGILRLRA